MTCRCAPSARCGRCIPLDALTSDRDEATRLASRPGGVDVIREDGERAFTLVIPCEPPAACSNCQGYGRISITGLHSRTCPECAGSGEA